jgi:hypothetical protein
VSADQQGEWDAGQSRVEGAGERSREEHKQGSAGGREANKEGSARAGQGGVGAAHGDGWASKEHLRGSEAPGLPRGERVARAVQISAGLSALLTLPISIRHMRSVCRV